MTDKINKKKSQAISKNIKAFNNAADCKFERNSKVGTSANGNGY